MKRLITLVLVLALLLPAAVLADDSDAVGFWIHCGMNEDNTPYIYMYYLSEDNVCYFTLKSFSSFYGNVERSETGKWEIQEDGTVKTTYGNARYVFVFSESYDYAVNTRTGDRYIKINESDMQ